jgi:hypothetical protein
MMTSLERARYMWALILTGRISYQGHANEEGRGAYLLELIQVGLSLE